MVACLRHRGPDDSGIFIKGPVGLGHLRLSIIDLSPTGHQPMHMPDGSISIIFNGEVYNFPELRANLEREGVKFRGTSDTEVVLHAFARYGTEIFKKLNGMYAMAIWDSRSSKLHLIRDRFGIKPLYYARMGHGIVFGSEIKSLLRHKDLKRRINWQAFHEYLYYGNPLRESTLFDGVNELLPGHFLTVDAGSCTDHTYWQTEDIQPVHDNIETATQTVRSLLETAVKDHLISDVPVGVFLSGGIDSSAITALATRHYGGRLKTYSVGFDFAGEADEIAKARSVAERFNTDHQEIHIEGRNLSDVIEKLVRCHDEPFGDAADIPLYLLCESLRGSVKVVLQGDGGDEIFAGYRRYNVLSLYRFWRILSKGGPLLSLLPQTHLNQRARRFLRAIGHRNPEMQLALWLTQEDFIVPPTRVFNQATRDELARHDPFMQYRRIYHRFKHLDPVQQMLYIDTNILLPDTFLEKVDKPTMAHSIEVRVPFLDANLTTYTMGLPSKMKVRLGQKKYILRRALRGIVPDDILDAPKVGFGVPYSHWLRAPLADYMKSVLLDPQILAWGIFDRAPLEQAMDEHISGRRNNGFFLWKLLNLALWYRFYLA
jgi:asparagine synthase (glutamine-hydrolysing)